MPTLKLHDSLLISALLLVVQAAVCAMIFESGHELGRYPALLRKLRTVACGSLRMGIAETLTVTCRASADGPAHPRPARVRPTGRHGVVCRRSAGAVRPRLRPGYVLHRLLSWSSLYITLFKCLYFLLSANSISSVDTVSMKKVANHNFDNFSWKKKSPAAPAKELNLRSRVNSSLG